jgi:hypothetical protein
MLGIRIVKRSVAILLVFLLLFNALGFYGLLEGWRYKNSQELVRRLDNRQYSPGETIIIKVPFHLPYQLDNDDYQRVDGEIAYQGDYYRLVKQKFENDTLYIVCIQDHESKRINQALADYVKTFTDKPVDAKHSKQTGVTFIKDFLPSVLAISHVSNGYYYAIENLPASEVLVDRSRSVFTPPPKI